MIDILNGILLGDAYFLKARLFLTQSIKNKEYVYYLNKHIPSKVIEYKTSIVLFTKSNKELKNRWTSIPKDLKLNWTTIHHWMYCSGSNVQSRKQFVFKCNFIEQDCELLVTKLKELDIQSFISYKNNKPYITIGSKYYFDFISKLDIPFECFKYKKDISKVKITKDNWGCNKLNFKQVNEIRNLYYNKNITYNKLANNFNVSKQTIYKIINNMSHIEINRVFSIKGECEVKTSW